MGYYTINVKQKACKLDEPEASKIRFKKPFDDDSFIERGMLAWFTGYEWDTKKNCYILFFDFEDFSAYNKKYFRETYYENNLTKLLDVKKPFYTALETGEYRPKYWTYFSIQDGHSDEDMLCELLLKYISIES